MENQNFIYLDIPEQLITDLESLFPHKCPSLTDTEREIFFYAGRRSMVEWLKERREMQEVKD